MTYCIVMPADLSAPRSTRIGVMIAVAALHVLAILVLVRAFAPDFSQQVVDQLTKVLTVTVITPPPSPSPSSSPTEPDVAGAQGDAGRKARPRTIVVPKPRVAIARQAAPAAAGKGNENASGARDTGEGTGAGGQGSGTGRGGSGDGQGGRARALEKIAGDISSTRDYPKEGRALRSGDYVIVRMTVGTDGRASNCRVSRASRDAEANAITCRLAEQRFRFRPRTNAAGEAVPGEYQWRQRWWDPRETDSKN